MENVSAEVLYPGTQEIYIVSIVPEREGFSWNRITDPFLPTAGSIPGMFSYPIVEHAQIDNFQDQVPLNIMVGSNQSIYGKNTIPRLM